MAHSRMKSIQSPVVDAATPRPPLPFPPPALSSLLPNQKYIHTQTDAFLASSQSVSRLTSIRILELQ